MKELQDLVNLLGCHSTPGDEEEVRQYLISKWNKTALKVRRHGQYAISAQLDEVKDDRPTVLVCAHMDSPGYTVEQIDKNTLRIIKLGGPHFDSETTPGVIKTRTGKSRVQIVRSEGDGGKDYYALTYDKPVDFGDRVCFYADPEIDHEGLISSPFLDNRIGCYVLCQLAESKAIFENASCNLVLGATGCEEVGCIGAAVLAAAVKPDFVICLDATYENPRQNVLIGSGPVLTLSDASVILSCEVRDKAINLFQRSEIPLQTEVYNYSGTDAKAFPLVGLECPVFALLVACSGNHSPRETASTSDVLDLVNAIQLVSENVYNFM